ncbi:hypothetical protein A9507_04955 [Methanobacterium sp. A39]|uniref:Uncharacterized protein n=1 Tax=Methanobacterium bryantii TaxID=2161 RepID=A0A2A2H4V8_METBR|nr:hypothetical protein A9507_04955 [Methanobacterium sp. A39]PAV04459.1 hypothetical protein ASJ80_06370 [Methanobacterium bryantii]
MVFSFNLNFFEILGAHKNFVFVAEETFKIFDFDVYEIKNFRMLRFLRLENTILSIDFESKIFFKTPCVIIDNCYKYIYTKNICKLCAEIMKYDY